MTSEIHNQKRKVWMEIFPGVALRGVVLKKTWLGNKVLFRDFNGKCYIEYSSSSILIDRD